jgi:hypothetical protein
MGVALSWRVTVQNWHYSAIRDLQARGVILWGDFEDLVGPDAWWFGQLTSHGSALPSGELRRRGYGDWLTSSLLCTKGYSSCTMSGRSLGAEDIRQLKYLWGLETVDLTNVSLSAQDLAELSGIRGLRVLHLDSESLTDDALPFIVRLQRLERLYLVTPNVSNDGVKMLASKLPRCRVLYFDERTKNFVDYSGE